MSLTKYLDSKIARLLCIVMFAGAVAACAVAGEGDDGAGTGPVDASFAVVDAPYVPTPDASSSRPDAFSTPPAADASTTAAPDATPVGGADAGAGLFCSGPADCPSPTECCWVALCVPGDDSLGICLPSN